ncbi:hypothetical protein cand_027790 [Cryptosporidium andersoni]|uniref:RING-type domain-containing protein n=1 Tax=Cryptosporidium andersoni TaxID=117008 RepID=A0A1J4MRF1_9CRYT|nr:hypothetical protein cand_027790 [Cryptosporidium andersoni]
MLSFTDIVSDGDLAEISNLDENIEGTNSFGVSFYEDLAEVSNEDNGNSGELNIYGAKIVEEISFTDKVKSILGNYLYKHFDFTGSIYEVHDIDLGFCGDNIGKGKLEMVKLTDTKKAYGLYWNGQLLDFLTKTTLSNRGNHTYLFPIDFITDVNIKILPDESYINIKAEYGLQKETAFVHFSFNSSEQANYLYKLLIKCKKQEYKYIGTEITENIKIHNNSSNLTEINNNKVELNLSSSSSSSSSTIKNSNIKNTINNELDLVLISHNIDYLSNFEKIRSKSSSTNILSESGKSKSQGMELLTSPISIPFLRETETLKKKRYTIIKQDQDNFQSGLSSSDRNKVEQAIYSIITDNNNPLNTYSKCLYAKSIIDSILASNCIKNINNSTYINCNLKENNYTDSMTSNMPSDMSTKYKSKQLSLKIESIPTDSFENNPLNYNNNDIPCNQDKTFTCPICCEIYPLTNIISLHPCGHTLCQFCEKQLNDTLCPWDRCKYSVNIL